MRSGSGSGGGAVKGGDEGVASAVRSGGVASPSPAQPSPRAAPALPAAAPPPPAPACLSPPPQMPRPPLVQCTPGARRRRGSGAAGRHRSPYLSFPSSLPPSPHLSCVGIAEAGGRPRSAPSADILCNSEESSGVAFPPPPPPPLVSAASGLLAGLCRGAALRILPD